MKIKILAFGQIAEIIGKTEISISDVKHTTQLNQKLKETFPLLTTAKYVLAVNQVIIQNETGLNDADVVALLPPFSGG